jgi:hypothetical protein
MSKLYEEALLDAKKIKEAAEQAAKDRIMESITPQIRQMINNRILFEQEAVDDIMVDPDDIDPIEFDVPAEEEFSLDSIVDNMPDGDLEDDTMDAAAQAAVAVYADGDVNIEVEQEFEDDDDEDGLMTDLSLAESFAKLVRDDFVPDSRIAAKIDSLDARVKKLSEVLSVIKENKLTNAQQRRLEISFVSLVKEAVSLQQELKHSGRGSQRLDQKLNSTIKEMREMSSNYKKNIFDFLFEAEDAKKVEGMHEMMKEQDEVEAEEVEAEVEEAPADEPADVDVDAASAALEDLGAALGLDLEIAEEEEADEDEEEEAELDLEEGMYEAMREMDEMDELDEMDEAKDMDEMYEIDESVLRRELARMRRSRKIRESAEEEADQFGGAEVLGDVIEIDEDTLINVLADELGSVSESRRAARRPARGNAARRAMREAAEYKKAATELKQQLVEMNLFNAKLLYANKLLQNQNLTVKQQRAIVEALDNAKTLREAKLLYKSLSDSLARRGQGGKLSESVRRTLGSSSRSTRSAQPAKTKSGVETDRWAVLAGIGKN